MLPGLGDRTRKLAHNVNASLGTAAPRPAVLNPLHLMPSLRDAARGSGYVTVLEVYESSPDLHAAASEGSNRLDDPRSWRVWDGTGFNRRSRDPYLYAYPPEEGVCAPVSPLHIGTLSESLTWSTYLKKWVLVGSSDNADGVSGAGF